MKKRSSPNVNLAYFLQSITGLLIGPFVIPILYQIRKVKSMWVEKTQKGNFKFVEGYRTLILARLKGSVLHMRKTHLRPVSKP